MTVTSREARPVAARGRRSRLRAAGARFVERAADVVLLRPTSLRWTRLPFRDRPRG